jgi:hypothetical protein
MWPGGVSFLEFVRPKASGHGGQTVPFGNEFLPSEMHKKSSKNTIDTKRSTTNIHAESVICNV